MFPYIDKTKAFLPAHFILLCAIFCVLCGVLYCLVVYCSVHLFALAPVCTFFAQGCTHAFFVECINLHLFITHLSVLIP